MRALLVTAVGLVVLALAAALFLPSLIDADLYRAEIAQRLSAATGRSVTIAGRVEVALLPHPRVRAAGLHIANAPGASAPALATAKEVEVDLGWSALFGGVVDIRRLRLIEPTVAIEVMADGRRNWDLAAGGAASTIRLDQADIDNGRLVWVNARTGARETIDHVQLRLSPSQVGQSMRASGNAVVRGLPLQFEAVLGDLAGGQAIPVAASITLRPNLARAQLRGSIDLGDGTGGQARLQLEGEDLRAAIDAFGLSVTNDAPFAGALGRAFSIMGDLSWKAGSVAVNDVAIQLGDVRATGAASLTLSRTPVLDMALAVNRLDVDRLRALKPRSAALPRAVGSGPGSAVAPVGGAAQAARNLAWPVDLDASLDLTVEALQVGGGIVRQARVSAALSRGDLIFNHITGQLPGGSSLSLSGQLLSVGGAPHLDGVAELKSDNLRALLDWAGIDTAHVPADRLRRFDGHARLEGPLTQIQIAAIDAHFDSSRLIGGVTVVPGPHPALGIDFKLDQFNADAYGLTDQLSRGNGSAALLSRFDANLSLRIGTLTLAGTPLETIVLDGTLQGGALAIRDFAMRGWTDVTVTGNGRIADIAGHPAVMLDIDVRAPDAARLLRLEASTARPSGPFALRGRLTASRGQDVKIEDMQLALGASRLTGEADLALNPRARLGLNIAGESLPLDLLLPMLGVTSGSSAGGASLVNGLEIDLTAKAASLPAGKLVIEDAILAARVADDMAELKQLSGRLYGGDLQLSGRADPREAQRFTGTLRLGGADLKAILSSLAASDAITGRADLTLDFSTSGRSAAELIANLSGEANVEGRAGTVRGVDLPAMSDRLKRDEQPLDIVTLMRTGINGNATRFNSLNATVRIDGGVARTDNLRFIAATGEAHTQGWVDFGKQLADLTTEVRLTEPPSVPPLRVRLTGKLENPDMAVDFAQLQSYLLRRANAGSEQPPTAPGQ